MLGRAVLAMSAACAASGACGRIDFDARAEGAAWWDTAWRYRAPLVIDHAQVAGELTDFPVLVELADPALAAHAAPDGHDLAFADATGAPLAFELESYRAAPASATAWVKLPTVSAEVDTTFYLYYGDAAAAPQADPAAVWSTRSKATCSARRPTSRRADELRRRRHDRLGR